MTTRSQTSPNVVASADPGGKVVALAGIGLIGYGILFLIWNFSGFLEIGLTSDHVGSTPEQIAAFSPQLYDYISHVQVALGGLIVALAWFGIRTGQKWALWTAFLAPLIALLISLPLHYIYGLDTLGHLGPIYLDVIILIVGTVMSYNALKA
jgi:hypothetical protein